MVGLITVASAHTLKVGPSSDASLPPPDRDASLPLPSRGNPSRPRGAEDAEADLPGVFLALTLPPAPATPREPLGAPGERNGDHAVDPPPPPPPPCFRAGRGREGCVRRAQI